MPIDPKQRRFLCRFYSGLIEALESLGQGEFESPLPKVAGIGARGVRGVELHVVYKLTDGMVVAIRVSPSLRKGGKPYQVAPGHDVTPVDLSQYETNYYSFSYGPELGESRFRFDRDQWRGPHVHIAPDIKDHIAAKQATPDTTNMDPRTFVEMVAKFRRDRVYPVKRKKR